MPSLFQGHGFRRGNSGGANRGRRHFATERGQFCLSLGVHGVVSHHAGPRQSESGHGAPEAAQAGCATQPGDREFAEAAEPVELRRARAKHAAHGVEVGELEGATEEGLGC